MPLLPLEPFVFPNDLLTQPLAEIETVPWWVLHTRPRTEKALARRLLHGHIRFFLPVCKHQWRNKGRLFCSHVPLFPGYVFLQAERDVVGKTLETNFVSRVLAVDDQRQLHLDLGRVYCLITSGAPLGPEERLRPGSPVEITAGPLAGMEGKILRRGKQLKFFVEVQFLQRGVSVEIESWMIQPRSSPDPLMTANV